MLISIIFYFVLHLFISLKKVKTLFIHTHPKFLIRMTVLYLHIFVVKYMFYVYVIYY